MKHPRLSAIFVAVSAATLLMASTAGFAAHKTHHKVAKVEAEHENFKGEANFKAEVPPPCPPVMMLHDGFYLGVGVGYDSYRVHQSSDSSITDISVVPNVVTIAGSRSLNHSATGWMGGIFAGYGRYFDWFYLGAEINANTSAAETSITGNNTNNLGYHATMKARTSYGIGLLPGIKVNDSSLLYVRLGYLRTNFKVNEDWTNPVSGVNTSGSTNQWNNGFNYGVGMETYVAEYVSVRGEYTHTSYNSKTINPSVNNAGNTLHFSNTSKFTPSNNEFMLSLLYHFA